MIIGVTGLFIYKPEIVQSILSQGLTAALGYGTSLNYTQPLGVLKYIQNFGLLVTGFAFIGAIVAAKLKKKRYLHIYMDHCTVIIEQCLLVWNKCIGSTATYLHSHTPIYSRRIWCKSIILQPQGSTKIFIIPIQIPILNFCFLLIIIFWSFNC